MGHVEYLLPLLLLGQGVEFKAAQFPEGQQQEVTRSAGRVKEPQAGQQVEELLKAVPVAPCGFPHGVQFVEE